MLSTHNFATSYGGQLPAANFFQVVNSQTGLAAEGSAFYALLPLLRAGHDLFDVYAKYDVPRLFGEPIYPDVHSYLSHRYDQ